jgi:hypothetical protein
VKTVKKIPIDENINGTNAHGDNQSMISGFNFVQLVFSTFGACPGSQLLHVSFKTNASSAHLTHRQQH